MRHCHKPQFDANYRITKRELRLWLKANHDSYVAKHQQKNLKKLLKRKKICQETTRAQHMCTLAKVDADAPPSSLCDPKRVQRVGFAELVRNLVPLPASSTKRGRGVMLEAPRLDQEEIKLFGHEPAFKTNTSWLEVILHAFGVGTNHGLILTHMTHHGPDSGEATTFPLIVFSTALRGGYIQMALFPGTPKVESRNCPDLDSRDFGHP